MSSKILKYICILLFPAASIVVIQAHENTSYSHTHLTGSWWGLRDTISNYGIDLDFYYKNDLAYIPKSGKTKKSIYDIQNVDLDLNLDFDKMFGVPGSSLFFDVQLINGPLPNVDIIKSVHGFSNIEAENNFLLYELLYNQTFFDEDLNFSFGLLDYNTEFDVKHVASNFITPAHGTGTDIALSGENGPSIFPVISVGLKAGYQITESFGLKLGIFDGIPGDTLQPKGMHIRLNNDDGWMIASEAEFNLSNNSSDKMKQLINIGFWYFTGTKTNFFNKIQGFGFYIMSQNPLYRESDDSTQGLSSYIRFGYVKSPQNPTDYFLAGAFEYKGLIPGRDDDFIGFGFTSSHISNFGLIEMKKKKLKPALNDTNLEIFYKLQIFPFFFIQPDIQYFFSPLLNNQKTDYLITSLRTILIL